MLKVEALHNAKTTFLLWLQVVVRPPRQWVTCKPKSPHNQHLNLKLNVYLSYWLEFSEFLLLYIQLSFYYNYAYTYPFFMTNCLL
jgi:hypothetical protein